MSTHKNVPEQAQDLRPAWLNEALQTLPTELKPEHDLWPVIAQNLSAQTPPQRKTWHTAAIAASVVFSIGSAVFTWQLWQTRVADQKAMLAAQEMLSNLRTPFEQARVSYQQQLPTLLQGLDAETAAKIQRNLDIIKAANKEIANALNKDPNDAAMRDLMLKTYTQELNMYQQLQSNQFAQRKFVASDAGAKVESI